MVSEPFASDFDHALLQRSSLRLACEQRTFRAPFALRFPPSLYQTAPTFGVGHLLLVTKDRRSFRRLQPELEDAANGFGAGYRRLLLGRPSVDRLQLISLQTDAYQRALFGRSLPARLRRVNTA